MRKRWVGFFLMKITWYSKCLFKNARNSVDLMNFQKPFWGNFCKKYGHDWKFGHLAISSFCMCCLYIHTYLYIIYTSFWQFNFREWEFKIVGWLKSFRSKNGLWMLIWIIASVSVPFKLVYFKRDFPPFKIYGFKTF